MTVTVEAASAPTVIVEGGSVTAGGVSVYKAVTVIGGGVLQDGAEMAFLSPGTVKEVSVGAASPSPPVVLVILVVLLVVPKGMTLVNSVVEGDSAEEVLIPGVGAVTGMMSVVVLLPVRSGITVVLVVKLLLDGFGDDVPEGEIFELLPGVTALADEMPVEKTDAGGTPAEETPVDKMPVEEALAVGETGGVGRLVMV